MRLRTIEKELVRDIWEFDYWVTPYLGDIRGTERFKTELRRIVHVLEFLAEAHMAPMDSADLPADLNRRVLSHIDRLVLEELDSGKLSALISETLHSLSAFLFLVTGKSDNNHKCQFPIFLRNVQRWEGLPKVKSNGRSKPTLLESNPIPDVLDSERYMLRVTDLYVQSIVLASQDAGLAARFKTKAAMLLLEFVSSVLSDEESRKQLSAFVAHFSDSKKANADPTRLLVPLVIFQVRGSVAASGGHEPEELLRTRMTEWGMIRDRDFNSTDVVLDDTDVLIEVKEGDEGEKAKKGKKEKGKKVSGERVKTRAYDFVLPYKTPTWHPRIFIQSQFYAGDSGSVSHKNVDQTKASRENATNFAKKAWPESGKPRFIEYVDGAGYCASLKGDLRALLSYEDTKDFIQVRSAPIRLRRQLQIIGFLTPLEVAHAVVLKGGEPCAVTTQLKKEGYSAAEVSRVIQDAIGRNYIAQANGKYSVPDGMLVLIREYMLLDVIAEKGKTFSSAKDAAGAALIPGFGPYYGIEIGALGKVVAEEFAVVWPNPTVMEDLTSLCKKGFAKMA